MNDSNPPLDIWQQLLPADRLEFLLNEPDPQEWWSDNACDTMAYYRHDPQVWGRILTAAQQLRIFGPTLTTAVDAYQERTAQLAPATSPGRRPPSPAPTVPPLPERVRLARPDWSTWLDEYAAHSAYWAPRAAPGYHQAVGLWVLSTIAARRIVVQLGSTPLYPTLFLALVAESTHWTKTTAASIGVRLLRRAGCGHLLAPDRTTPQFLLKIMSGLVPQNYGQKTPDEQEQARDTLAFAAQRGWFYEEWGGMLHQMRRTDSPQAELNKLLIVLEGGAESFETGTIQRGLERIIAPYLALMGNATPHDLAPFMGEGDAWWHDGFWPRFAIITPPPDAAPSRAPRPREAYTLPAKLLLPLHEWHQRLGTPPVAITEEREANDKKTGAWVGTVGTLPCRDFALAPEVYDAYETYNDALLDLVSRGDVAPDLSAWYGRAHEKALRVALLLASLHGSATVTLPYWQEGQVMAEHWRANLHAVVDLVGASATHSPESRLEARIERCLALEGAMTARDLQRRTHAASEVIRRCLESMVKLDLLTCRKEGRRNLYSLWDNDAES